MNSPRIGRLGIWFSMVVGVAILAVGLLARAASIDPARAAALTTTFAPVSVRLAPATTVFSGERLPPLKVQPTLPDKPIGTYVSPSVPDWDASRAKPVPQALLDEHHTFAKCVSYSENYFFVAGSFEQRMYADDVVVVGRVSGEIRATASGLVVQSVAIGEVLWEREAVTVPTVIEVGNNGELTTGGISNCAPTEAVLIPGRSYVLHLNSIPGGRWVVTGGAGGMFQINAGEILESFAPDGYSGKTLSDYRSLLRSTKPVPRSLVTP